MGWLEELARAAGHGSLGRLAKKLVEHDGWPEEGASNPRSVENQLRALDQKRRQGQVWLENRPDVRELMAELLGVSADGLDPGAQDDSALADPRVPLHELRDARPLDLRRDALFPGIPEEVLDPSGWGLTWWFALAGSGRTVVGRWLEARGKAVFLRATRWSEVVAQIPAEGAVYVELAFADSNEAERWPEGLEGRNICVAAPFFPEPLHEVMARARANMQPDNSSGDMDDEQEDEATSAWTLVTTPPYASWASDLARWVGRRMDTGGGYDATGAADLLMKPMFRRLLRTPGDAIGICGVIEHIGAASIVRGLKKARLAELFLAARIERTDLAPRSSWSPADLWRLLIGCAEGALVHSERADGFVLEVDLIRWLPTDALPPGDPGALQRVLDEPELSAGDLATIRSRARPSARGAIAELRRLHLIESVGDGVVELRPTWLATMAGELAIGRILEEPARGLGLALLHPARAGGLLDLFRRLGGSLADEEEPGDDAAQDFDSEEGAVQGDEDDDLLLESMLRDLNLADPASVALLEAIFQAVGLALLDPRFQLSPGSLERIWRAQMSLAVPRYTDTPPQPRVFSVTAPGWLERAWEVACLTISERLWRGGRIEARSALAPWALTRPEPLLSYVFQGLSQTITPSTPMPRVPGSERPPVDLCVQVLQLAGRLRSAAPMVLFVPHTQIFAPANLVAALKAGSLPSWTGRLESPHDLTVLLRLLDAEGVDQAAALAVIWASKRGPAQLERLLARDDLDEPLRAQLWRLMPGAILGKRMADQEGRAEALGWAWFSEEQWAVILDRWAEDPGLARLGLEHIPHGAAHRLLAEQLGGQAAGDCYAEVWERFPDLCRDATVEELLNYQERPGRIGVSSWTPDVEVASIAHRLLERRAELLTRPEARVAAMRWSHHHVALRGPGWRTAWELLGVVQPPG